MSSSASSSSAFSLSSSGRSLSSLFSVAALCLLCLARLPASAALTFSSYDVTWSNATGQSIAMFTSAPTTLPPQGQNPLGPFQDSSDLIGPTDSFGYAGTFQQPIQLPWPFLFFGVNYTTITVTSKGFLYMGNYTHDADIQNLATAAPAPDYSVDGAGVPPIDNVYRAVISYLHTQGGAVPIADLVSYGPGQCLKPGGASGGGQCVLANFFYEVLPVISSTTVITGSGVHKSTQTVVVTPVNSVATPADGERFVLVLLDFRDESGVKAQLVVVLYQFGLIEIYYYSISPNGVDPYGNPIPDSVVSIGIQAPMGGAGAHFSAPSNNPTLPTSQQTFSSLNQHIQQSAIHYRPMFT